MMSKSADSIVLNILIKLNVLLRQQLLEMIKYLLFTKLKHRSFLADFLCQQV